MARKYVLEVMVTILSEFLRFMEEYVLEYSNLATAEIGTCDFFHWQDF